MPRTPELAGIAQREHAGVPVLALGLRPFYLLAGVFAVGAVPLWIAVYSGNWYIDGYLTGVAWHSHEMVFGFAAAVIAGFLLTAVRNWTNRPTATGGGLAALAILWLAARVLAITGPAWAAAIADVVFLPTLAFIIAVPIWRSRDKRNIKVLAVLMALTLANAAYHLAHTGMLVVGAERSAMVAAIDIIAILIAIMGGRVIPAFTANAIQSTAPTRHIAIEVVSIGSLLLILTIDILQNWLPVPTLPLALLFAAAAMGHGLRLSLWAPHRTYRNALLWMLPVAYAWIPITLALRGLAVLSVVPASAATHALTLGAMSGLMLAMMMRSALGHTGRSLVAGPAEMLAFIFVQFAAIVRVIATLGVFSSYAIAMSITTVLWSVAFLIFVARYWPILTRAPI